MRSRALEAVVPRLVDARRLAGGADEESREQVGQGRVIVPVPEEALQEIRAPEERAVRGQRAAQHEVVAAAGAGVPPVENDSLGIECVYTRFFVVLEVME